MNKQIAQVYFIGTTLYVEDQSIIRGTQTCSTPTFIRQMTVQVIRNV